MSLAVFAKIPLIGYAKTRLEPALGQLGALSAHRILVHRTLSQLQSVDNGTLWLAEPSTDQQGVQLATEEAQLWGSQFGFDLRWQLSGDLGDRMSHTFSTLFAEGKRKVVLVGCDCPLLDAEYVNQAYLALDQTPVVFGAAEDGGYCLIALDFSIQTKMHILFESIPWGTSGVLAQSQSALDTAAIDSQVLPALWDVDEPADWHRFIREVKGTEP